MMANQLLLYKKDSKEYKLVVVENTIIVCNCCKKVVEIGNTVFIQKAYNRFTPFSKSYYCSPGCLKKRSVGEQDEVVVADLTNTMPDNGKLIDDWPTELTSSRSVDLFQATMLESDRTSDNTIHAGRDSIKGARIGNLDFKKKDKRTLKADEIKGYIENLKKEE